MSRAPVYRGRRQFLRGGLVVAGLVLLTGCGRLPLPDSRPGRMPRVGCLSPANEPGSREFEAFGQELRELGHVEGQTIALEHRRTNCSGEPLPAFAAELVSAGVDIVVTDGLAAATAARDATSSIPIMMAAISDPVGGGLVASLGPVGT